MFYRQDKPGGEKARVCTYTITMLTLTIVLFVCSLDMSLYDNHQAIYQHSWEGRKGAFAAGPDTYRDINYERDDTNRGFTFRPKPPL